ncbi:DUF5957 family protein [Micromonospora sp. NPDC049799]|uniref:DUF5957 family protein n=1 Tax=Micromonospora sp. NPDC049799 TaxID=3154741 RepID=UPI0033EA4A7C
MNVAIGAGVGALLGFVLGCVLSEVVGILSLVGGGPAGIRFLPLYLAAAGAALGAALGARRRG